MNFFSFSQNSENYGLFNNNKNSINLFNLSKECEFNFQGAKNIFKSNVNPSISLKAVSSEEDKDSENGNKFLILDEFNNSIFKTEPDVKVMKYDYKN